MALSAPTKPVWIIAVVLGVLGLLGRFVVILWAARPSR